MGYAIAVDGPAGAGKSTIAKLVARKMDLTYIDTGAMYRGIGIFTEDAGIDPNDEAAVSDAMKDVAMDIRYIDGAQHVFVNGSDVTGRLREEKTGNLASTVSRYPAVRSRLVDMQRKMAAEGSVIMDGRDIGTVVLPDAQLKIYLTASADTRAQRRYKELVEKGETADFDTILDEIVRRDDQDMHRAVSPLKQAEDAVFLDTSDMTIEQVVDRIVGLALIRRKNPKVILAKTAGFCFGVQRAVTTVYDETKKTGPLYTYGEIIHNETVVSDLEKHGVKVLESEEDVKKAEKGTVVIRSHGVSKDVYDNLKKSGFRIVDATCPFVLKIHKIAKEVTSGSGELIIVGDRTHPEVQGICGWCEKPATVIDTPEEAEELSLPKNTDVTVVSQTTFNLRKFEEIVEIIESKGYNTNVCNTICSATEERQTEARRIAATVDAMIVIGGKKSSNTRKLYEICKRECPETYLIQTFADLNLISLAKADSIGITAGASTPNTIIEEVLHNV
ncbi:MAG: 4-hydroxy-3-methylbut-2-enyl diphosphate reductase [Lachnospiraceae bacterium]|jgi:4-hydroxy-3-methylbut-2-enyl diphosphate reductase